MKSMFFFIVMALAIPQIAIADNNDMAYGMSFGAFTTTAHNVTTVEPSTGANRVIKFAHCTYPLEMIMEVDAREVEIGDVLLSRFLLTHRNPELSNDLVKDFEEGKVEVYYYSNPHLGPGAFSPPQMPGGKPRFIFHVASLAYAGEFNPTMIYRMLTHENQHYLDYKEGRSVSVDQMYRPWNLSLARSLYLGELRAGKAEYDDVVRYDWHWSGNFMGIPDMLSTSDGPESIVANINFGHLMDQRYAMYTMELQATSEEWLKEVCSE